MTDREYRRREKKEHQELNKQYKIEAMEATENILMNAVDRGQEDFKDYKEEVLDWSWDNIMKGND